MSFNRKKIVFYCATLCIARPMAWRGDCPCGWIFWTEACQENVAKRLNTEC